MKTIESIGEEKTGLVNVLVDHICAWWMADPANLATALKYKTFIIDSLTFGPVHVKGKRSGFTIIIAITLLLCFVKLDML